MPDSDYLFLASEPPSALESALPSPPFELEADEDSMDSPALLACTHAGQFRCMEPWSVLCWHI